MKSPTLLALALSCSLVARSLGADAAAELLTEAQTAYMRGEYESAKAKFESVYKLDPKNRVAIGYLKILNAKEAQRGLSGNQEKQLARLIVPSVQFRDATVTAVLEALRQQAGKLSEGKQAINFVVQLPPEQAQTSISLSLSNVPFTEVLKYVGVLANATFVYDRYAIIVKPTSGTAAAKPESKPEEGAAK